MTATIRETRPGDHDRLRAIQREVLAAPSPDLLRAAVDGPLLGLVRCDDAGHIVGYVLAVLGDSRAYLPELAVAPNAQRQGHGTALLREVARRLDSMGVDDVRVTTRADDTRARSFYETRDFDAVERIPDYYDDGTAGVVYRRYC
jgi:ribosomal-protein-alanine N-acetyltransferase